MENNDTNDYGYKPEKKGYQPEKQPSPSSGPRPDNGYKPATSEGGSSTNKPSPPEED